MQKAAMSGLETDYVYVRKRQRANDISDFVVIDTSSNHKITNPHKVLYVIVFMVLCNRTQLPWPPRVIPCQVNHSKT